MRRVEKPWGHEVIWAETDRYAGKLLHIEAGHALSLQYHERKAESIYVLEGRLHLHHAASIEDEVTIKVIEAGAAFDITPGTVHRFEAREAVTLVEVSTPDSIDDHLILVTSHTDISAP